MEKQRLVLVCKHCWINAVPVSEHQTIGKGKDLEFKHKSLKDGVGQPFCGRVQLSSEDVEYVHPVWDEHLEEEYEDKVTGEY